MPQNKYHWYDGWFYDTVIAPHQDKLFSQIKNLIDPGSDIIDIGCGTGRFEFTMDEKCKSIIGIDLSKKNIDRAQLSLIKNPNAKISFRHMSLGEIINNSRVHFDYAVLTYVIHEVDEGERINLLTEIASVSDKIIIGDYLVPGPKGFGSFLNEIIEFIAGSDHYRNYKSFIANGGIYYLADKAGLKVIDEISDHSLSHQIVVLSK